MFDLALPTEDSIRNGRSVSEYLRDAQNRLCHFQGEIFPTGFFAGKQIMTKVGISSAQEVFSGPDMNNFEPQVLAGQQRLLNMLNPYISQSEQLVYVPILLLRTNADFIRYKAMRKSLFTQKCKAYQPPEPFPYKHERRQAVVLTDLPVLVCEGAAFNQLRLVQNDRPAGRLKYVWFDPRIGVVWGAIAPDSSIHSARSWAKEYTMLDRSSLKGRYGFRARITHIDGSKAPETIDISKDVDAVFSGVFILEAEHNYVWTPILQANLMNSFYMSPMPMKTHMSNNGLAYNTFHLEDIVCGKNTYPWIEKLQPDENTAGDYVCHEPVYFPMVQATNEMLGSVPGYEETGRAILPITLAMIDDWNHKTGESKGYNVFAHDGGDGKAGIVTIGFVEILRSKIRSSKTQYGEPQYIDAFKLKLALKLNFSAISCFQVAAQMLSFTPPANSGYEPINTILLSLPSSVLEEMGDVLVNEKLLGYHEAEPRNFIRFELELPERNTSVSNIGVFELTVQHQSYVASSEGCVSSETPKQYVDIDPIFHIDNDVKYS